MKLILASTSPYRKELLMKLGIKFDAIAPNIDESTIQMDTKLTPVQKAKKLSYLKAKAVYHNNPKSFVIGSDQICHLGEKIFNKTNDLDASHRVLSQLSGKTHCLSTAYSIIGPNTEITRVNITKLHMKNLSSQIIKNYLNLDKPIDCAGSYKIEQYGIALFNKIETSDHSAIIGLALIELSQDLQALGFEIFEA